MKQLLIQLMHRLPLSFYKRWQPMEPFGVFYHIVTDEYPSYTIHLYPHKTTKHFEQDLVYLKKHFNIISHGDLQNSGKSLKNSVLITFDDGLSECYNVIAPILERHGLSAVFFITTDFINNKNIFYRNLASLCLDQLKHLSADEKDKLQQQFPEKSLKEYINSLEYDEISTLKEVAKAMNIDVADFLKSQQPYMTSAQIKDLHERGFTIGAHGKTHRNFAKSSAELIREEITESVQVIQSITGQQEVPFAFPFSADGVDTQLLTELKDRHPEIGYFFDTRDQPQPSFMLRRFSGEVPYEETQSVSTFQPMLKAAYVSHTIARMRH